MKRMNLKKWSLVAGGVLMSSAVYAAPPANMADLLALVDFTETKTGILGMAAALIGLFALVRGVNTILPMVKGGR